MSASDVTPERYFACPAHRFCVDFGVFRGDPIGCMDDLNLGDMYQLKPKTGWFDTYASGTDTESFDMNTAANAPVRSLLTIADLIFMTTTGRRADVFVTFSDGQLYLVASSELTAGPEYVLIDIRIRDVGFTPVVEPMPISADIAFSEFGSNVIPLRLLG